MMHLSGVNAVGIIGNFSMKARTCSNLYKPFSAHWAEILTGGLTLALLSVPLNTNSNAGIFMLLVDETMVITVDLSQDK